VTRESLARRLKPPRYSSQDLALARFARLGYGYDEGTGPLRQGSRQGRARQVP